MVKKILFLFSICLAFNALANWPNITAKSWLVTDANGKTIQSENPQEVRSIASITKLATVMVVLDARQDLDEKIEKYTRRNLIQLTMVRSDNQAAKLLCRHYPGGEYECVKAMNAKALELDMYNTKFHEPTGLSVFNVSTAEDLVKLTIAASKYDEIVTTSKMSKVEVRLSKRLFVFNNTNPIIGKKHDFIVSKTGWITASGGCIVMMLDTDVGRRVVVVLGSKNTRTRIPEAQFIAENY